MELRGIYREMCHDELFSPPVSLDGASSSWCKLGARAYPAVSPGVLCTLPSSFCCWHRLPRSHRRGEGREAVPAQDPPESWGSRETPAVPAAASGPSPHSQPVTRLWTHERESILPPGSSGHGKSCCETFPPMKTSPHLYWQVCLPGVCIVRGCTERQSLMTSLLGVVRACVCVCVGRKSECEC